MISTIVKNDPVEFDAAVNEFERKTCYKTGVSRVFATQTHVTRAPGMETQYVAVIFYKPEVKE